MTGGYQKDALLEVYPFEKLGAGESVQYQYAILNSETMNKVICKDSSGKKYYNYKAAMNGTTKGIINFKTICNI